MLDDGCSGGVKPSWSYLVGLVNFVRAKKNPLLIAQQGISGSREL